MVAPSSHCPWWVFGFTLLGLTREASAEDAPTVPPPAARAGVSAAVKADASAAPSTDLDLLTFYNDNFDARWRPRYGQFWRFTPYLYGQLFTGYGETLLNYDHSLTAIRVGIGFSDRSTRSD